LASPQQIKPWIGGDQGLLRGGTLGWKRFLGMSQALGQLFNGDFPRGFIDLWEHKIGDVDYWDFP